MTWSSSNLDFPDHSTCSPHLPHITRQNDHIQGPGTRSQMATDLPLWTLLPDTVDDMKAESSSDELDETDQTLRIVSDRSSHHHTEKQAGTKKGQTRISRPRAVDNISKCISPISEAYSAPPSSASHQTVLQAKTKSRPISQAGLKSPLTEHTLAVEHSRTDLVEALTSAFEHNSHIEHKVPIVLQTLPIIQETASTSDSSVSTVDTELEPLASLVNARRPSYGRKVRAVPARLRRILREDEIEDLFGARLGRARIEKEQRRPLGMDHDAMGLNLRHLLASKMGSKGERDMPALGRDGAKSFATPAKSRKDEFVEVLHDTFGSSNSHRGHGRKPNKIGKALTSDSSAKNRSQQESVDSEDAGGDVHGLNLGLTQKRKSEDPAGGPHKRPELGNKDVPSSVDKAMVAEWVVMMQPLIKGKINLNRERLRGLSDLLHTIDGLKDCVGEYVLEVTRLRQSVMQLSELEDIPFGDEHGLRSQALALREYWSAAQRRAETERRLH